ncbi:MAG: hypothetical protein MZV64_49230 [Ignavibacteriales bacterium]|nr:hypothetical protein [Ignavibacteriales bacterium]
MKMIVSRKPPHGSHFDDQERAEERREKDQCPFHDEEGQRDTDHRADRNRDPGTLCAPPVLHGKDVRRGISSAQHAGHHDGDLLDEEGNEDADPTADERCDDRHGGRRTPDEVRRNGEPGKEPYGAEQQAEVTFSRTRAGQDRQRSAHNSITVRPS